MRRPAAIVRMATFLTALRSYKADVGVFPSTDQGLQALREEPMGVSGWAGPYLTKNVPMDPWGRPYLYKYPGQHGAEPDIVSLGRDGRPGGEGIDADIVSWKNN